MAEHPLAEPKWTTHESSQLSRMMRERVFAVVRENLAELGDVAWADVVNDRTLDLFSKEDAERIEREVVDEFMQTVGRKLLAGSEVAVAEKPDRYVLRSEFAEAEIDESELAEYPQEVIGIGDNAFQASEDVEGEVLVIRQVSEVSRLMEEGVPVGTVGVIDDAGGTMTAPILPEFDAVLCRAGTVRSHLAIIAREYGVPTLMAVVTRGELRTGDHVRIESSARAQNVEAYHGGEVLPRARIWKVDA